MFYRLLKNLSVGCLLITTLIDSAFALEPYYITEDITSSNTHFSHCLMTPSGSKCATRFRRNTGDDASPESNAINIVNAILLGSASVANEVQNSRLQTITTIQEMQKQITNLNTVLNDNYKGHLLTMQKLMLERINAIAKDPSWSQESYETLKLRLIKDLSDVFESKHE